MPSTLTSLDRARAAYVETILQLRPRTLELRLSAMARVTPEWAQSQMTNGLFPFVEGATENSTHSETN
jgi:hypothetical protein